ncbi:MAG: alpha/beta hydrolase [Rubripirellula sp.]|nr:alpha/beta hydrolase [Rubripirellula sp.]
MPLDEDSRNLLAILAPEDAPEIHEIDIHVLREAMESRFPDREREPVARVEDRNVAGPHGDVPVRLYWPQTEGTPPVLVYFHGGGWVLGSLETHDAICRALTNAAQCMVVSVDYRLAPEHPFPCGLEDCQAAVRWVRSAADELGVDGERIAVGGDSAGGNLAAVVANCNRDENAPPLCHQLLIYPVTDASQMTASYRENAQGYLLTALGMKMFWDLYLEESSAGESPLASPCKTVNLAGLPSATVLTAQYDPLRDEGEVYAERLQAAGNQVAMRRWEGVFHGFVGFADRVAKGQEAILFSAQRLRASFDG